MCIRDSNILLADGQLLGGMGTDCGCSLKANGLWIERFRNGELKEQGNYYCNEKIGTWTYGNELGKTLRIETYKRPYSVELSSHRLDFIFQVGDLQLTNRGILNGAYKEFHQNGEIKVEGQYQIIEEYTTTDTISTFDPETYEEGYFVIKGEFWKPISIKIGLWNYYDQTGKIIKTERIRYPNNFADEFRWIQDRYAELFQNTKKD